MNNPKMSEVFKLPLRLDETWWGIYSGEKQVFKLNFNFEPAWENEAHAAIHAINSHDKLVAEVAELKQALTGLLRITEDSDGVTGYHLNGDMALWSEFEEVEKAKALLGDSSA